MPRPTPIIARMELHLVRHGQTLWNAERRIQGQLDSALDERGREQARALSPALESLDIGAVYCSTSGRARETLSLAMARPPEPVRYRDELREIRLGTWQGRLWAEVERECPAMVEALRGADEAFDVEGSESYAGLQRRGVAALERIVAEAAAETVLVVSHGALIKAVLAHYAGHPLATLRDLPSLPNCSRSVVLASDGRREVVSVAGRALEGSDWDPSRRVAPSGAVPPLTPRPA